MNAYSSDLRERIAQAYDEGAGSQRTLAARFRVSRTFVERLLRRRRETGSLAALPRAGGQRSALDAAALRLVAQLVRQQNDLTLSELCDLVERGRGLRVSVPTMHRAVVRLGLRTKKTLHASERDTPRVRSLRAWFRKRAGRLDSRRLLFLDESGINLAMTRLRGRAPRGERVVGSAPQNYGAGVTLVAALGARGVRAAMSVDGPTDTEVLVSFIREVLAPRLRRGDILVMDNLSVHKTPRVREAVRLAGAELLDLPPYSPDLSLVERCWSKLKAGLRKAKARPREAPGDALAEGFAAVAGRDAKNWFRYCGYALR